MLPIEKNKEIIEQIARVTRRANNIHEVKDKLFNFIKQVMDLNSSFSVKINHEMTKFQQFVMKNSLYYEKSNHIIGLSKLYREFSLQIERNAKLNLISLSKVKTQGIAKQDDKLKGKCQSCIKQFQKNGLQEKEYNKKYETYSKHCQELAQIITGFKSYQSPISFYNKILINQDLLTLQKKQQECSTSQTQIITNRQMLDEQRGFITQNIKQVNENYFVLIHNYLVTIQTIIKCIVYPKNQEKVDKAQLDLRASDNIQEQNMLEMQRLQNLYSSETCQMKPQGNPFEQFSELFRKSINQFEINSDYRFFHDRCETIRNKKLKASEESYKTQHLLIEELKQQLSSYTNYEGEYKKIEKENFTNNGIESYKKRFRKYFGSNFTEIFELCLNLIERQKKSLEKICRNMGDNELKMRKVIESKKDAIAAFKNRSEIILNDHKKLKQKVISGASVDSEELQHFKSSITASFNQFKKEFMELERSQRQDDKLFFTSLKSLYQVIMNQATSRNLNKLLSKQTNRTTILNNMNINHQILLILKEDSRYQNLLNECPKPNLYSTFLSLIPKKQVDETKILLQKKDQRLKNMIRPKQGCCGIKSEVIKLNILAHHKCKLKTEKGGKHKGVLNISSNGIIFEESMFFFEGLQLIIPQTDIKFFDVRTLDEKEVVEIGTQFGALHFESQNNTQIIQSMQKNLTFTGVRQPSQPGNKRNDSSSFLKNNTSTEFKMSYDKSLNSNSDLSRVLKMPPENSNGTNKQNRDRGASKPKTLESMLRELVRKWKEAEFFGEEHFKKVAAKSDKRRDYDYQNGHSKFFLRQMKEYRLVEKDLIFKYKWKVSFPESQMLHSFRHQQEVRIENITKQMRIRIVSAPYSQEQLYIKNKFYKEIQEMNKLLCQFIVYLLEKEADVINEQEYDQQKSLENYNIVLDDINVDERESKFERTQSMLRLSKIERKGSVNPSVKG